jgi:AsmA protein
VPARVALTDLAGIDAIDGTASATLSVRSRGATWGEFARALAGNGAISVRRGTLAGIDLIAVAETMADPLAEPMDTFGGSTAFSNLTATLAIGDGGLAAEDLSMKGAGFDLALSGKGSLINGLIEGNAELSREPDASPLKITGRWRAPIIARAAPPDAAGEQAVTHEESGSATGG